MTLEAPYILVVDDEPFMRHTVKQMLRTFAARVGEARTAEEALTLLQEDRPDLVLCDIGMEPMDGLGLLTAIRESKDEALRKTPFIMLTGHAEKGKVAAAVELGISGYLVKPVSPKQLTDRLRVVLAR